MGALAPKKVGFSAIKRTSLHDSTAQGTTMQNITMHPHMSSTITFPFTVSVGALASATPRITSHGTIGHDKTIQNNALSHAVNGKYTKVQD